MVALPEVASRHTCWKPSLWNSARDGALSSPIFARNSLTPTFPAGCWSRG